MRRHFGLIPVLMGAVLLNGCGRPSEEIEQDARNISALVCAGKPDAAIALDNKLLEEKYASGPDSAAFDTAKVKYSNTSCAKVGQPR